MERPPWFGIAPERASAERFSGEEFIPRIDLKAGAETSSSEPFQKFLYQIGCNSDLSSAQTVI